VSHHFIMYPLPYILTTFTYVFVSSLLIFSVSSFTWLIFSFHISKLSVFWHFPFGKYCQTAFKDVSPKPSFCLVPYSVSACSSDICDRNVPE
jgi:hypothetical protein